MAEKACRQCMRIIAGDVCPVCNTSDLSEEWRGLVIILDPKRSEIAKKLQVDDQAPDRYALKVH